MVASGCRIPMLGRRKWLPDDITSATHLTQNPGCVGLAAAFAARSARRLPKPRACPATPLVDEHDTAKAIALPNTASTER